MFFEGALFLNFVCEGKKSCGGGVSRRGAAVAAGSFGGNFKVHITFFGNADDCVFPVHSADGSVNNCAAFVDNDCKLDSFFFKIAHCGSCSVAAGFFVYCVFKINIAGRNETFRNKFFDCLEFNVHCALAIHCAAAVNCAVDNFSAVSRAFPAVVVCWNNVLVAHEKNRSSGRVGSLPFKKQSSVKNGFFKGFVNVREKFFQNFVIFIKLGKVLVLVFGNGWNSYHIAEFFCGGFNFLF